VLLSIILEVYLGDSTYEYVTRIRSQAIRYLSNQLLGGVVYQHIKFLLFCFMNGLNVCIHTQFDHSVILQVVYALTITC